MAEIQKKFKLAIMPGIADLYNRAWPEMQKQLKDFVKKITAELRDIGFDVYSCSPVSTQQQVEAACSTFSQDKVDVLIVSLAPYCPSGVLAPALIKCDIPILVWPTQGMFELEPEKYDFEIVLLNHGVHAVQDLANVLRRSEKAFGVIHGHLQQKDFKQELENWVRAGRAICAMRDAKAVQIGGHFEDMLDLQIGKDEFLKKMGLRPKVVSLDEFAKMLSSVTDKQIQECVERYRVTFDIGDKVDESLLSKTARGEAAVRSIMSEHDSYACGLNFLELCNDNRIADGLHVTASMLMRDGMGYAGEGDWVTAVLVRAMQQGFGTASFSEMFSVGYADNRLVLKHWGEGNFAMARGKPRMCYSSLKDSINAEFAIVDFEFESGRAALVNLNSTPAGQGQLISIAGKITKDHLPKVDGPRAVFKSDCEDVRDLLTEYAYNGGSHHLALVQGDPADVLEKVSRLSGWLYISM